MRNDTWKVYTIEDIVDLQRRVGNLVSYSDHNPDDRDNIDAIIGALEEMPLMLENLWHRVCALEAREEKETQ